MAAHVCILDWHVHPFRAERWLEAWAPAAERCLAFGARSYTLSRSEDDPLHFRQTMVWDDAADFERYWAADEVAAIREQVLNLYNKPLLPQWHSQITPPESSAPASPALQKR